MALTESRAIARGSSKLDLHSLKNESVFPVFWLIHALSAVSETKETKGAVGGLKAVFSAFELDSNGSLMETQDDNKRPQSAHTKWFRISLLFGKFEVIQKG